MYQQKPFYTVRRRKPTQYHVNDRRHVKDLVKLQVSKYINSIVQHCLSGEIWRAQRQSELAMKYMNDKFYRPPELVNTLYEAFGLALYLVNQDVPNWSNELNNNRILYLFGSNTVKNNLYDHVYEESYFGSNNSTKYNKQLIYKYQGFEPNIEERGREPVLDFLRNMNPYY